MQRNKKLTSGSGTNVVPLKREAKELVVISVETVCCQKEARRRDGLETGLPT